MKTLLNPKIRVALFLLILNAAWILAAWAWVDRENWLWITPIALSINALLLTYDQLLTFSELECEPLVGQDPWGLLKIVHELAEKFDVPSPQVFRVPHASAQVFCYGKTARRARLFVTEGAIKILSEAELRAVIAYQLTVVEYSYSILNYWVAALIDVLFRMGRGCEKIFALIFGWTPPLAKWLVSPWIALLQLFMLSRNDYRKIDGRAALKLAHPEDLARALWKMNSYSQTKPWREAWVFSHMCMVSPLSLSLWSRLLRIQPSLKGRIKGLIGRYPL